MATLTEWSTKRGCNVIEYGTNNGHVHMLIEASNKKQVSSFIRTVKEVSKQLFNQGYEGSTGEVKKLRSIKFGYRVIDAYEVKGLKSA